MSAKPPTYAQAALELAAAMPAYLLDYAQVRLAVAMMAQLADETDTLRERIAALEKALRVAQKWIVQSAPRVLEEEAGKHGSMGVAVLRQIETVIEPGDGEKA